ncbi:hypothetical protein [Clostridium tertium]|uniref:hypothetical protein n=1 Tax=Clostridium tertium TaxID=1559 RepID=UPI0023B30694|nr:hypothetical protein [Clostridium tertium]
MRVKNFCYTDYIENKELQSKFIEENGYKVLLSLVGEINEYAGQVNSIAHAIETLNSWKKESFYTEMTSLKIIWHDCYCYNKSIPDVTLKQANELYKEAKMKYDTLYSLIAQVAEIHYKGREEEFLNEYFSIIDK